MNTERHAEANKEALRNRLQNIYVGVYKNTPYFKNLPCEIEDIDEGWVRLRFAIKPHLCNYRGIASGGVLAAFCDTLMGMASRTLGYRVTTLEINMNYIRRIEQDHYLTGIGQVVHQGGKTIVVECECFDESGCIVVKGRSSFYVLGKLD
ncbi:hypothetical protein AB840_06035 [Megasphaera cerevisiae DSM 20462]|uniref:Thioesterase domain-containing protein n=1 Tax=Megasphaera cerevisiae DSM 20462 TaxID=1122219 RepID=A0A0J6WX06_9FIRM|nr:PaaI family thioesterase [Megasphaera cerevisiae]KMO86768.1 hypothetical protein AB840_06035 [Megasphaera cerevisiae DSM 20462]SJZ35057.1 Thioesterase superfamily protein [Megasphaera cerevisiae DSM 20462]